MPNIFLQSVKKRLPRYNERVLLYSYSPRLKYFGNKCRFFSFGHLSKGYRLKSLKLFVPDKWVHENDVHWDVVVTHWAKLKGSHLKTINNRYFSGIKWNIGK